MAITPDQAHVAGQKFSEAELNQISVLEAQIDQALVVWLSEGSSRERKVRLPTRGTPSIVLKELVERYTGAGWNIVNVRSHGAVHEITFRSPAA